MRCVTFWAPGKPAPQGSKVRTKTGMREQSAKTLNPWRKAVRAAAEEAMADAFYLDGPLVLQIDFKMPRPQYHFGTGRNAGALKTRYRYARCPVKPDLDKLVRAIGDSLTETVYLDDSQIVRLVARKTYADDGTGALITVREVRP
jgi:crossover junction endodeoxyribonuclease RusA